MRYFIGVSGHLRRLMRSLGNSEVIETRVIALVQENHPIHLPARQPNNFIYLCIHTFQKMGHKTFCTTMSQLYTERGAAINCAIMLSENGYRFMLLQLRMYVCMYCVNSVIY